MTSLPPVRLEGLSLPVSNLTHSVAFYELLGFEVEQHHGNAFAMLRLGEGTLGLLSARLPDAAASQDMTHQQRATIQVELTTDDLDGLYAHLSAKGVNFHRPPHDDAWERSMQCFDPDGYTVEFAQGLRGHNEPPAPSGRVRTRIPGDSADL